MPACWVYFCRRGLAGNIITSWSHGFNSISSSSFSTALSCSGSSFSALHIHTVPYSITSSQSHVGLATLPALVHKCTSHTCRLSGQVFPTAPPSHLACTSLSPLSPLLLFFPSLFFYSIIITIISEHLPCSRHCARRFAHNLPFEIVLCVSVG